MQWNIIQLQKGTDHCYLLQHGQTSGTLIQVEKKPDAKDHRVYDSVYKKCQERQICRE